MSRSGEDGPQPVPGPVAAATRREEDTDAALGERERRPDPDDDLEMEMEVIALSPRALTAASPFACEACGKGFLREQSLQLHRRGHADAHNDPRLPRRDSRRSNRKRVYVCPVASCARHDPGRAPADLAGIRRHYRRRHGGGAGRKLKWKCDLCGECYGADHDWEAHARVCGAAFSRQRPENVSAVASALHSLTIPFQAHHGASGLGPDMRTTARRRMSGCRW